MAGDDEIHVYVQGRRDSLSRWNMRGTREVPEKCRYIAPVSAVSRFFILNNGDGSLAGLTILRHMMSQ